MATSLAWYDDTNTALTAALSFTNITPGTATSATEIRLINNLSGSGADTLTNSRIYIAGRDVGETDFVQGGKAYLDGFYVEMRVIGGRNQTPQNTPWTPLGAGRFLPLEEIANDEGIYFEIRVNPPAGASVSSFEIELNVDQSPARYLQLGLTEIADDGVLHGIGDPAQSWHLIATDVVEDSGGASADVEHGLQVYLLNGEMHTIVPDTTTITAAASSNFRIDALSLAADGTITITSGTETAGTPVAPDMPEGELPLCFIDVDDASTITDSDITNVWEHGMFTAQGNGLNLEVGEGWAVVDNSLVITQATSSVPLTASDDNWVWLTRSGGFSVTLDDTPPESRALLLYEATTDGSGVTTLTDRRNFIGGQIHYLTFQWEGSLTVNDERVAILPSNRKGRILPGHIRAACLSMGGASSGSLRFLLEVDDGGFTSVFSTNEQPPEIAYDASPLSDLDAIPEVWDIPAGAIVKAEPDQLPSGGTPADAILAVPVVLNGGAS